MRKIVLADSGGTRTDWCLISEEKSLQFFSGVSYHPSQWNENFIMEQSNYWLMRPELREAKLIFYGAGCLNPNLSEKFKEAFIDWGFSAVEIYSDIHAAGVAAFGDQHGFVAIMGTGSVFAELNKKEIIQVRGGLGYLLGDEGSGYFFGKLIVQKYLNNNFDDEVTEQLKQRIGNRNEVIKKVYLPNGKMFLSSIAALLMDFNHPTINMVHEENLRLFLEPILKDERMLKSGICFCGSYAWGRQAQIREILAERNLNQIKFVKEPIVELAEYTLRTTL